MIRKLMTVGIVACIGLLPCNANTLQWGEDVNFITDNIGGDLPYDEADGTVGAFVQLIYAGSGNTADAFAYSGTGVTGDDVVVGTSYSFGQSVLGTKLNQFGFTTLPGLTAADNGKQYYVRVYSLPNSDFASGSNAVITGVSSSGYYWESSLHSFAWSEFGPDDAWSFGGGSDHSTVIPIPEPSTILLFGLGALTLVARRAKRK